MTLNNIVIGGTLCGDPEVRTTTGGTAVTTFTLAQNERWMSAEGEKQKASFFEVVYWGKTGETIAKWFRKGGQIIVTGKLKQDQWQDKETGAKRSKIVINGWGFEFCNKNSPDGYAPAKSVEAVASKAIEEAEEALPF